MNLFLLPFLIYIVIIVGYLYFNKKTNPFQAQTSWWKSGISLFAVKFSITTPLIYSGLMHAEGVAGLWLFWVGYAISGFLPFVFAPLWAKLNFLTDNQFLLFRFSGKGAKAIHVFRTVYVGWIVVAFLMSFQLLALLKVVTFITGWERQITLIVMSLLLMATAFKNKLGSNIQLDFFNTILISIIFIGILLFFLIMPATVNTTAINLEAFPSNKLNLLILFFVQTWSVNLFDGSGVEAQRFFATKKKSDSWKVALLSALLALVFSLVFVLIIYIGADKLGAPSIQDREMFILSYLKDGVPDWFLPFVVIAFFAAFITSFEGLLNWGASFLTIDGYKTYIHKEASARRLKLISILSIFIIVLTSLFITYFNDSLTDLIKIFFSISAGVAPVFVIRWFWMRINGWSQLAAMLSSGIYTLIYQNFIKGTLTERFYGAVTTLNQYSLQLLFVTVLTTITWLIVTFLTPKDDPIVIEKFRAKMLFGYNLKKNLFKAISFGAFFIFILYVTIEIIKFVYQ